SEIADEVEDLVAGELVAEAQGSVLDAVAGKDNDALLGCTADEAHVAEFLLVFAETEGAGGSDLSLVGAGGEVDHVSLTADGSGEVDAGGGRGALAGIDADALIALADFNRFEDAEVFAAAALGFEADLAERFGIGQGTAVEDRQFEVVDFDDDVVDAGAEKRGEQVLRGGDEHALAHEAGGVADFGDVTPDGGNIEAIEVGTAKDDAATGRSGQKLHANGRAAMESDTGKLNWGGNGIFQVR